MAYESILKRLQEKELITPYLESSIVAENWPDFYNVKVDSSPYYGAGDGYFHPSTHPLMGARELYYRFHPDTRGLMVQERPSLRREMIFAMGSALHAVVQTQMLMCGLVKDEKDIEVEYILKDQHVRGRADWTVHHPNGGDYVVEMKTQDTWLYKKQDEVKPAWDAQLSLAEYALGIDQGILLLVERGGGFQMREFPHRRNDNLLDEIFEKFAMVRQAIAVSQPPTHCCTFDSPTMTGCAARFSCWLKEDQ